MRSVWVGFLLAVSACAQTFDRDFILGKIRDSLRPSGIELAASRFDYNIFEISATLRDVVLTSTANPKLPPILRAREVRVNLGLRELLRGNIHIQEAAITNPVIQVMIEADGRDNIPRPRERGDGETAFSIENLVAVDGRMQYEDRRRKMALILPVWSAEVHNSDVVFETRQPGVLRYEGREAPLQRIAARLAYDFAQGRLGIRRLELAAAGSNVALSGDVGRVAEPVLNLKAEGRLAVGQAVRLAGTAPGAAGDVNFTAAITGPPAALKVDGALRSENLAYQEFRKVGLDAQLLYDAAAKLVRAGRFTVRAPAGTVAGNATLALAPQGRSSVEARLSGVDLMEIARRLDLPVRLASRAGGTVKASWPGLEFKRAEGEADLALDATRELPARDVLPLSARLSAGYRNERLAATIRSFRALDAQGEGSVTLAARERLGGEIRLGVADMRAFIAQLGRYLGPEGPDLQKFDVEGPVNLVAGLGGTIDDPRVDVRVNSPALQLEKAQQVALRVDAGYAGGRLTIRDSALEWRGQSFFATGTVGVKGAVKPLDLNVRIVDARVPTLLAAANRGDISAEGVLSGTVSVTGTVDDPRAAIALAGRDLSAYGEPLGTLALDAGLSGRTARVTRLHLEKPGEPPGTLDATGEYNLDTKAYTLTARTDNFELRQLVLPNGMPVRGEIDLAASGSGTASDPALDVKFAARDLTVGENEFGALSAQASVAQQVAVIKAEASKYNATVSARLGTQAPHPVTFEAEMRATDLALLPVPELAGGVSATVTGSGNLEQWKQGTATARVSELDVKWRGQPIRAEGPLVVQYANSIIDVEPASVIVAGSRLNIAGQLPVEAAAGDGDLKVEGTFDLEGLSALAPAMPPARGQLALNAMIGGSLERLRPEATLALRDAHVAPEGVPPLADANATVTLRDGMLLLDRLQANWAGGTLAANGTVPLGVLPAGLPLDIPQRPGPAELTLDLKGVDLSTIEALPEDAGGALAVHAELRAPRLAPEAVTGRITFPELSLKLGSFELAQPAPSVIEIANGVARFQQFALEGPDSNLAITGTAGLAGARPLDVVLEGSLTTELASVFVEDLDAQGMADLRLAVSGTMIEPRMSGFLELNEAQFAMESPDVLLEDLNLRLDVQGNRVTVARLEGFLNGGPMKGSGSFVAGGPARLSEVNLQLNAENVYFNFPEGLKSVSNLALNARSREEFIVVGGTMRIQEGTYTDDITIEGGLAQFLQSRQQGMEFTGVPNPLVARIRFDLEIVTESPLAIDNNLAKIAADARLRLLGSPYQPGLTGRVEIEEGGEIFLNERNYLIERGVITFVNENRIQPQLDLLARTEASGYDIALQIQGEPGKVETTLTSDPPLGEVDIIAVLLTGRTMEEVRGEEMNVARDQVFSYLAGRAGQTLAAQGQRLGLTTLRVEPSLIAPEADPTARLTAGQAITRHLDLIYSLDLANAGNQIWIGEYDIGRRFVTRGIKQEDNSFRFEFRHDLRFGGKSIVSPFVTRRTPKEVGGVKFVGNVYFSDKQLADRFGVKAGDEYDFFKVRRGLERVREFYADEDLLEARVRLARREENGKVFLELHLRPGERLQFVYEGWEPSGGLKKDIRRIWQEGVFDAQRAGDAMTTLRKKLVEEGHLQAEVSWVTSTPAANVKRVLFEIHPGVRYRDARIDFAGAKAFERKALVELLEKQKLVDSIYVNFREVKEFLRNYYREQGYLDAEIEDPRFKLNPETRTGAVVIPVEEGPRYLAGDIVFKGNRAFTTQRLRSEIPLKTGEPFLPALRAESVAHLQDLYWRTGYNDMNLQFGVAPNPETARVTLTFDIEENQQRVVKEIAVEGTDQTAANFVRAQMPIQTGQIAAYPEMNKARSNLYGTGAYTVVELETQPLPREDGLPQYQQPVRLLARVNEVQPFRLLYGGFFDTDRGPGGIVDFSNRNTLGDARVIGTRLRYDSELREARLYFSQPFLRSFPVRTSAVGYGQRELRDAFITDRLGFTLEQEARFRDNYLFTYGYRIERAHTFDRVPVPDFPFDVTRRIAPLSATLSRETRDDILDPTRGSFMSQAGLWGAGALGSELRYLRYFGQYYRYFPLSEPVSIPWVRQRKSRWVYATAVRVGLAGGLGGQEVAPSERFFAGGGTTIRGFKQDAVGPQLGDLALGGNALFILNNEIRFPLRSIFDGVGFVDLGNVYPLIENFDPTDLRKSVGVGLRVRTPYFLLRLDWGVNVSPREGEPRSRFFFSIGQAF